MDSEDCKPEKPELELTGADLALTPAGNACVGDSFQLSATAIVCCVTEEIGEDGVPTKTVEFSLNALNLAPVGRSKNELAKAMYPGC